MIMGRRCRTPVCEVVVKPAGAGLETRLVLLVALLTITISGAAIVLRNTDVSAKPLPDWRVDAFSELDARELAVFNALYTAAPEIELYHEEDGFGWPTVDELAAAFIPPFVQDTAWEQDGAMGWTRSVIVGGERHIALYVGHPSADSGMGTFMLVMLHDHSQVEGAADHPPCEIWMHPSPAADIPVMAVGRTLITKGWREVVARKGASETLRTKGDFVR